jgi:hypothetical protein
MKPRAPPANSPPTAPKCNNASRPRFTKHRRRGPSAAPESIAPLAIRGRLPFAFSKPGRSARDSRRAGERRLDVVETAELFAAYGTTLLAVLREAGLALAEASDQFGECPSREAIRAAVVIDP